MTGVSGRLHATLSQSDRYHITLSHMVLGDIKKSIPLELPNIEDITPAWTIPPRPKRESTKSAEPVDIIYKPPTRKGFFMKKTKAICYPWKDHALLTQNLRHPTGVPITAEMYLKIQWIINNKPGYRSMRAFLTQAVANEIDRTLAEFNIK